MPVMTHLEADGALPSRVQAIADAWAVPLEQTINALMNDPLIQQKEAAMIFDVVLATVAAVYGPFCQHAKDRRLTTERFALALRKQAEHFANANQVKAQ